MKTKFKQFTDISKITHHPKITKNNKKQRYIAGIQARVLGHVAGLNLLM